MAEEDLNIRVVTTADTAGIRQTSAELDKLKQQQATFAETARREAAAAKPPVTPPAADTAGLTGSAVAIGTIISLLTGAINKWKEFNAEQDKWVEGMIRAEEKVRALGESILDMQDKARSAARVGTEPLEQSFIRLQQEIIRLKTEQNLLNLPEQGEEYKKLAHDISIVESQLKGVTSALQRQAEAAKKAAQSELEKRVPGLKAPEIKEADAQTQRILMNEQAAAKAKAEGREKDAEMFQRSADQYKASATPQQLADLQRIHELQDKLKPPPPPTYKPFSPEEFQRRSEEAEPEGAGKKLTPEEMKQRQLEARADRYQEVQKTRGESNAAMEKRLEEVANTLKESNAAMKDRLESILVVQRQMLDTWK